jgi:hypothetical protein
LQSPGCSQVFCLLLCLNVSERGWWNISDLPIEEPQVKSCTLD